MDRNAPRGGACWLVSTVLGPEESNPVLPWEQRGADQLRAQCCEHQGTVPTRVPRTRQGFSKLPSSHQVSSWCQHQGKRDPRTHTHSLVLPGNVSGRRRRKLSPQVFSGEGVGAVYGGEGNA